jgi:hypothetical protein
MSLMKPTQFAVRAEGELVVLRIGDSEIKMGYEAAIQLSQWLRVRGKQAKKQAGDMSRHWSAIGILDGLEK